MNHFRKTTSLFLIFLRRLDPKRPPFVIRRSEARLIDKLYSNGCGDKTTEIEPV